MTHEEFVHICLKIRKGDVTLDIPCCANCGYYRNIWLPENVGKTLRKKWVCLQPSVYDFVGNQGWINTRPEDFCSRWEARDG